MSFKLPDLPYAKSALEPYISAETLDYHHGKHHAAYINKLNGMVSDSAYEGQSLEEIVRSSSGGMFNNAAQAWNHDFYWKCLSEQHDQAIPEALAERLRTDFKSVEEFKTEFTNVALTTFGSGWAWLVADRNTGQLTIISTPNAGTPLTESHLVPLLTCDVWEHAYYIDTRNNRAQYVENFWHLVNWQFVASQFASV